MRKTTLALALATATTFCVFASNNASAADYTVNSQADLATAIADINAVSNGTHTITLGADITVNDATLFPSAVTIENGNTVTLLGSGHTLTLPVAGKKLYVNNATLNLGTSAGTDSLTIVGSGATPVATNSLIEINSSILNMYSGTTLKDNASTTGDCGLAIRIKTASTANIYGGTIENTGGTSGGNYGGAIAGDYAGAKLNISGGEFKNNFGTNGGVFLMQSGEDVNITGGTFSGNYAQKGNVGYIVSGNATVSNATFENNNNSSVSQQGGVFASGTNLTVSNSVFRGNGAQYGGAILNINGTAAVTDCLFEGNEAATGGAIYSQNGSFTSSNNIFMNNEAAGNGGAIYANGPFTSQNDNITSNTANRGAGLYAAKSDIDFETTDIYNNKATTHSNDVYIGTSVTSIKLKDAASMGKTATFDGANYAITGWFADAQDNRYSSTNHTDEVTTFTAGTAYYLTAATDSNEPVPDPAPDPDPDPIDPVTPEDVVNPATGDNLQAQLLIFGTSITILMFAVFIAAPIDIQ